MESAVAEIEAMLQTMVSMKPPGVSGSKITIICQLCNANIQVRSILVHSFSLRYIHLIIAN